MSSTVQLSNQNKIVIDSLFKFFEQGGYSKVENKKTQEIYFDSTLEGSQPSVSFKENKERKTLIIELLGSPWHIVIELAIRYLKELGVTFKSVIVNSTTDSEKLFEVDPSIFPNLIFAVQQRLKDRNLFNSEINLIIEISTFTIGKKQVSSPSPLLKKTRIPIKGPSPVMFKRSKLSQLAKRDIPEPEPVYVPPPKPEIPEEFNLPILDELGEDERTILKEILKRPKKKVQSNHIAKHTNLEQEIIRDVLRDLVNKGILKVTSGWYVLKKQSEEAKEEEKRKNKRSKKKKSSRKKKAKKASTGRTRKKRSGKSSNDKYPDEDDDESQDDDDNYY